MSFIKNKIFKKTICLGLSAALIYNTTVPAFGQEFFYNPEMPAMAIDKTYYDNTRAEVQSVVIDAMHEIYTRKMQDNAYARAEEIKEAILGDPQGELQKLHFDSEYAARNEQEPDYAAIYLQQVQEKLDENRADVNSIYKQKLKEIEDYEKTYIAEGIYSQEQIASWKAEEVAAQNNEYQKYLSRLDDIQKQEIDRVTNHYEEFLQELKAGAEESFYEYVKGLFDELMGLYDQKPYAVKEQILELTPIITTLTNGNKQHIYTEQQQNKLLDLYRQVIQDEREKVGKSNSILTNYCEIRGYCPELLNAIAGISVLSPESRKISDGNIIFEALETFKDTAASIPVLTSVISGLLVMKNYNLVREILRKHTDEEHGFSWSHVWDNLNFMAIPIALANTRGKYLGHVSDKGEYWDEAQYNNIYSDIALILAEDGSQEALSILREFGVNKCLVERTSGVKKETLSKYSISCGGIKPFLVGALLSGKSGANQYTKPMPSLQPREYFGADGKIYSTPYARQVAPIENAISAYYDLAREGFNGDAEAMIAFHIMSEGMGDLNVQAEYSLDTTLYNAFKDRIPEKFLGSKYIIIDEARKSKKENRKITEAAFVGVGMAADIWFTVYCLKDLALLGGKIFFFGKNLFNVLRVAKLALGIRSIPALAKLAARYTKTVFMRQKIVVKASNMAKKLKRVPQEYKNAVRVNTLSNAAKYTNAVHDYMEFSLSMVPLRGDVTRGLARAVRKISYDENLGFVLGKGTRAPRQVMATVNDIFDVATVNAKSKYRVSRLFKKGTSFSDLFLEEARALVNASPLHNGDKQFLTKFFQSADFELTLGKADAHIASLGRRGSAVRNFAENPLTLPGFLGEVENQKGKRIGVDFVIGEKMPAFADNLPQYASIVDEKGRLVLKFFKGENEALDLSAFKLSFGTTESFTDFARASAGLGEAGKIELKFIPKEANTFWTRNFRNVFASNKEKLFGGTGTVTLLKEGKQIETGITLKTYKKYDGLKVFINEDLGGAISVFKGTEQLPVTTTGAFYLPKYQIKNFLNFANVRGAEAPWKINLLGGKNKVNALYLQSMVSLSVASTGLVGPLSRNYPDMDMKELTFISLIFPYLLSAATPFVSPLVKKFGAIKMLKTSMYLSLLSLALPIAAGFNGFGGIQADNPFSKPSPSLLYPSALLIGLATTLTRGSYSPLIQAIGGGSGTLKAVAFKSISSFMLILPPLLGAGLDKIHAQYFKNPDGSLYLDENGQPVKKHWFDFSFSYPVMLAVAGAALYKVQKAHFNHKIGRSPNAFTSARGFFQDVGASYGLLFKKDLLPLTISSALLAGAESSLLYTYSNSMANEYVRNKVHTEELVPVIALIGLNAPAFITRMNSKPILRAVGGDNVVGYRNMLTVSLVSAGVGSYLLATQDDPLSFSIGLALTSVGFSQITSSILRYGHSKLETEFGKFNPTVTSWDVSYPTVYIGMSAVPYLYGYMNDKNIEGLKTDNKADMVSLKNTSWQEVIGIPIAALALGGGLSYYGMRPKTALRTINGGGLIGPLGLAAESHNHGFTTLALPKPMYNQQPYKVKTFEPHLEYKPELMVPALQVTPNFSIQPLSK